MHACAETDPHRRFTRHELLNKFQLRLSVYYLRNCSTASPADAVRPPIFSPTSPWALRATNRNRRPILNGLRCISHALVSLLEKLDKPVSGLRAAQPGLYPSGVSCIYGSAVAYSFACLCVVLSCFSPTCVYFSLSSFLPEHERSVLSGCVTEIGVRLRELVCVCVCACFLATLARSECVRLESYIAVPRRARNDTFSFKLETKINGGEKPPCHIKRTVRSVLREARRKANLQLLKA